MAPPTRGAHVETEATQTRKSPLNTSQRRGDGVALYPHTHTLLIYAARCAENTRNSQARGVQKIPHSTD